MPDAASVVKIIAKDRGETIQMQGAEAALRFGLSTQAPMTPLFETSGPSREFKIGNLPVRLKHLSQRQLRLAGKPSGMALSALWHLEKNIASTSVLSAIRRQLPAAKFAALKHTDMPVWMARALAKHGPERVLLK